MHRLPGDIDAQLKENESCRTFIDPKEDRCRHELAADCDVNTLLKRYEPWQMPARETFYGERDYDLDPHDAVQANRAAWEFWQEHPEVQSKYATFGAFLNDNPVEPSASERSESAGGGDGIKEKVDEKTVTKDA